MGKKAVSKLFYYVSIVLTLILAGITLAAAFASDVPPANSRILPFIGLAVPVLLLVNLVVSIYWILRWRYWLFIPLIAILGNWGYLSCVFQFFTSPSKAESSLTIATYNVDSFGFEHTGYSCKEIAAYMESQQADILCFQEFGINQDFTTDSVKAALSNWPYALIPYTPDSIPLLQLALFSKYPIRNSQLITYPDSKNCSMWCDIDVNGKMIRVFNNHLQTTEVSQNKQRLKNELSRDETSSRTEIAATRLLNGLYQNFMKRANQAVTLQKVIHASPHPTLVCGDFNSLPSSFTYRTIKGSKLQDGFQTCGHGYMYTFRYFKHLLRIDYILHSKEIEGIDYFSPELDYSDHNPVVMKVHYVL